MTLSQSQLELYESYGWDTFYNKKRNYPNAEERLYDDLPEQSMDLVRSGYKRVGGMPLSARFLSGSNTCILSKTKRELLKYNYSIDENYMLVDDKHIYRIKSFHFNEFPKYPILD